MTDQGEFQVVKKRENKNTGNSNQKKLSFKELLFERNNLKKYQHSPKVDLRERGNTYVIRMELPGLEQSDVKVQVRDSQFLLVSGTKNNQHSQEGDNVVYSECHYGNFMRRVKVPVVVRSDNVRYSLNNGVLHVTLEQAVEQNQEQNLPPIPEDTPLDFSNITSTGNWADEM
jgi:HSP20 family molecular chaperone IbpA